MRKVRDMAKYWEQRLNTALGTWVDEAYIINLENKRLQEEVGNSRELVQELRGEMELKEWEIGDEGKKLRKAQKLEIQSVMGENERLRKEIKEQRQLIWEVRKEMEFKERQIKMEGERLRGAQEQEVQSVKRENEGLREEIEKQRQLTQEYVKREMKLKAREIEIEERTLREAEEPEEREKADVEQIVAKD